jgi:huntingtin interacting protein 1
LFLHSFKGTSTVKEFYSKNHKWTEGLVTAAKLVGLGANVLIEKADHFVNGNGKLEEIIVCSNEIAASTAQLVVASNVNA